ncbi:MAG: hypothetical protein MT490_13190 [Sphingomonas sp.]|uniref:hypothetical protein n=1 Tax=Sphingomonas sp. TaxID=28214 RepID=UPI002274C863|nr:hypothetical protein [Sphingomonas sp.]MCX8476747.1 hypothetical protein [Sphingomonas sp.]
MKITGLDKLQRTLSDASKVLGSMDGTIAQLRFNPNDPASVEEAVREMERAIDAKTAGYSSNPLIRNVAAQMKVTYAAAIRAKADQSRDAGAANLADEPKPAAPAFPVNVPGRGARREGDWRHR